MATSKTKIEIYGDFQACGFSRAAKAAAEDWFQSTPYCSSAFTLVFYGVPLGDLRAFKQGGEPSARLKPVLGRIHKAHPGHDLTRTTLPAIFIGPKWVKDGFSGLDGALKALVCALPSKPKPRRSRSKTKPKRSRSKSVKRRPVFRKTKRRSRSLAKKPKRHRSHSR